MRKLVLLNTFLLSLTLVSPAWSQTGAGTVSGKITDASGANVPNVRVELENTDTGQRITIMSDTGGTYTFNNVPPGRYRIITTGTNAASAPSQEITVEVSRTNTINITMPSGPGTDVIASVEEVETTTKPASVQDIWNTRYIHYLPQPNLVDRNGEAFGAYNLAILSSATVSSVPGWPGGPGIAGQRPNTNLFHVDGVDNHSKLNGGPVAYLSNEATTEFTLLQNQNSPLFGQTGGPKFNSIMRSGTNQAHGSIYDYLQNRWFNAVDRAWAPFGFNENNQPKYDQNRLGASLGMPIIPSKIFFFGNFEYIPMSFQSPYGGFITTPTAAGFTALGTMSGVSASNLGILRNALGTGIPQTAVGFTPVGGVNIPVGFASNIQRNWQNQFNGAGAMDFNLSDKDQLRFRYVHNDISRSFNGAALSAFQAPSYNRSIIASLAHYHTFGNSVTNELRLGYNRNTAEQYFNGTTSPAIGIGGGFNIGVGPQYSPAGIVNTFHLADGVNFRFRGHQLRAGFDGRRYLGFRTDFPEFGGNYFYSSLGRFLADLPPDVVSQRAFGNNRTDLGQWLYFGYLNDTWNMRPGLTLDIGVRYQYAKIPRAWRNQSLNQQASVPGLVDFNTPDVDRANFAPFVGVAWSPKQGKTVVRGGFGMYYDATYLQPFSFGYAPQITQVVSGNLFSNTPGFLAGGGLQNPAPGGTLTTSQARQSINSYLGNQTMPYSMQWNVAVQQAILRNTTLEIKYMGNRGVHMPIYGQLNYNGVTATNSLPLFSNAPTQAQLNALPLTLSALQSQTNAFTAAGFTSPINSINYNGNSWYNGASIQVIHSYRGGLQMQANYTWSRWEDDSTGTPLDIGLTQRMRTWSMFDKRHQASVTALYELAPLFKNTYSILRNVFADFNLSGSYIYSIGSSLTPVAGVNSALANNAFGTSVIANNGMANDLSVSGLTPLSNSTGGTVGYLVNNPNAQFIQGAPGVYTGSNRGGIRLPDVHNVDIAAVKRFNFRERASFEIRGEAYNIFNRYQPGAVSLHSIGYGTMTPLSPIPGTVSVSNLANLQLLPSNPRTLQFALRVSF